MRVHMDKIEDFTDRELVQGDRKIVLEYIGEGASGDYDRDDPHDWPHLRFSVYDRKAGEWEQVDNASYCTNLPTALTEAQQDLVLGHIMRLVYDEKYIKRICEQLSWLDLADVRQWEAQDARDKQRGTNTTD